MLTFLNITLKTNSGDTVIKIKRSGNVLRATLKLANLAPQTIGVITPEAQRIEEALEALEVPKKEDAADTKPLLFNISYQFKGKDKVEFSGEKPFDEALPDLAFALEPLFERAVDPQAAVSMNLYFKSTDDFTQEISIDRKTSTLVIKEIDKSLRSQVDDLIDGPSTDVKSERKFKSKMFVTELLDSLSRVVDTFVSPENPQTDDITPFYKLSVAYANGKKYVLSGPYNTTGVPENFESFVEALTKGVNELEAEKGFLDLESLQPGPITDGVIYLSVSFGGGKTYYYKTDDKTLKKGQSVLVPTGNHDVLQVGIIERVDLFDKEEVPFPLEKVKSAVMRVKETIDDTKAMKVELKRFLCIYIPFLTAVSKRSTILEWCENYSEDDEEDDDTGLVKLFEAMNKEAYLCGLVFKNYRDILKFVGLSEEEVLAVNDSFFIKADVKGIEAAVSYHFSLQTFSKEEFYKKSIASGALLKLLLRLDKLINK